MFNQLNLAHPASFQCDPLHDSLEVCLSDRAVHTVTYNVLPCADCLSFALVSVCKNRNCGTAANYDVQVCLKNSAVFVVKNPNKIQF